MKTPKHFLLTCSIFLAALVNSHAQPVIIQQPQNQTNFAGATVILSVAATGTPPLSYQWRSCLDQTSFTDILGATDSTLSVNNIQPAGSSFCVLVSDANGSVTSALARIYVEPTITQQPEAQTLPDGSRTSFSVQAVSSATLRYQWFFDGTPLVAERGKTLDLYRVESEQAGDYSVVITNQYGSATSVVARLAVTAASGPFTRVKVGSIGNDMSMSRSVAWGDYDDDGFIDLFVGNIVRINGDIAGGTNSFLYHNNGDGTFTRITNSPIATAFGSCIGGAWGDYDNDGKLDLMTVQVKNAVSGTNHLFRGLGGGAFVEATNSAMRLDFGNSRSVSWVDYDNDGFLDLFVGSGFDQLEKHLLFHNNGNANHWLKFRLIGTRSNRSAIGAKVRLHATINGRDFWQLREVSGGDGYMGQNDMRPNFGLGDGIRADIVRIEWPSGTVQELHDVAANQILTVTEPALLEPTVKLANGVVELRVQSWLGFTYEIQASSDLKNWTSLGSVTNATDRLQLPDADAQNVAQRFYRAVQR